MPEIGLPDLESGEISPLETARYTADLLENLRKIAARQGLGILAHLLELAQAEARMVARSGTGTTKR
jgi:hypothetical protein